MRLDAVKNELNIFCCCYSYNLLGGLKVFFPAMKQAMGSVRLFITGNNHSGNLEFFININSPKEEKQGEHDEHCDLKLVWKYVSADNGGQDVGNLARVFLHHIVEILQHPKIVQTKT